MDFYREQLLDHYHHPQGWGLKEKADLQQDGFNPLCGDRITIQLMLEGSVVTAMHFEAEGCVISRAAASLLTEAVAHKTRDEVAALTLPDVEALLGNQVPPGRVQCALLALSTIHAALQKYN